MRKLMIAAAACLAFAGGLGAGAPRPAQAATAAELDAANRAGAYVASVVRWSEGYNQIGHEQIQLLNELIEASIKSGEYYTSGQTDAGRAWAADWGAQQRRAMADLKLRLTRLPPAPPRANDPDIDSSPSLRPLIVALGKTPQITSKRLETTAELHAALIDVIVATAGGDEAAARQLPVVLLDVNIAVIKSQSDSMDTYVAIAAMAHSPQEQVLKSSIRVSNSIALAYGAVRDTLLDKPVDRAALATRLRAEAAGIDQEVERMRASIATNRNMDVPGAYGARMARVMTSFDESRVVMAELAGRVRSLADGVERGPRFDSDAVGALADATASAANKLADHDRARKAILAG